MKTEFKMSEIDIKQAIAEYFIRRGLEKVVFKDVSFKTTPRYDNVLSQEISAIVNVSLELADNKPSKSLTTLK